MKRKANTQKSTRKRAYEEIMDDTIKDCYVFPNNSQWAPAQSYI